MRLNDWSLMPMTAWGVMVLAVVAGILISKLTEWLAKPHYNKWSDWRRK